MFLHLLSKVMQCSQLHDMVLISPAIDSQAKSHRRWENEVRWHLLLFLGGSFSQVLQHGKILLK